MSTKTFTQFRVDNVVTTEPTTLQYGKEVYYKDPNGVMTLYVGDENGNAQRALPLATPARKIYVFGGADNSFPYFSTFANALTYANSLTPSTTNPVSIVLLSQNDGTPFVITGADDWYALCLDGIYVSSPYREIFSTTTLPTTLPKGMRVMYVDANGVESLWVGNADGEAWPAVGYKEYVARITTSGGVVSATRVLKNDIGTVTPTLQAENQIMSFNYAGNDNDCVVDGYLESNNAYRRVFDSNGITFGTSLASVSVIVNIKQFAFNT